MLNKIARLSNAVSRSISAENFNGEKGKGGMATEGISKECARDLGIGWKVSPCVKIKPGEVFTVADIKGPGVIRHIWMTDDTKADRELIFRIFWENQSFPSIETPLGDFFASAQYKTYSQLTSLPVCVNPKNAFNCYWEMPFLQNCKMTVENIKNNDVTLFYQVDYTLEELPQDIAYFHAQFRRTNPLPYKEDYTILDNISGKGQYVGTYMLWGSNNSGWWGEGEIKFFMDGDKEFPTICGTGTEDYFCGSYCFEEGKGYLEYSTPFAGLPRVSRADGFYKSQQRFSMYRWHICDPIYFNEDIKVTIQALSWRSDGRYLPLQDDLSSVAYFYLQNPTSVAGTLPDADGLEII